MLTDAELDELERKLTAYEQWEKSHPWSSEYSHERHVTSCSWLEHGRQLLAELRSARATIAEMRGRLERALASVDAALGIPYAQTEEVARTLNDLAPGTNSVASAKETP